MPKRILVCRTCGSDRIVRDAWACWSFERQDWELGEMFDHAFCLACENECTIQETAAEPSSPPPKSPIFIGEYPIMTTAKPRPDFQAYTTRKRPDGQKDVWIDIGAGFLHRDGAGINIVLQATPLDGRIVLRPMPDDTTPTKRD